MNKESEYFSQRLTYRGLRVEDAELVSTWRSNPDNYRNFLNAHPVSAEEHLAWFANYLHDDTRFDFIIRNADGKRIGTTGISNIDGDSCEVSYMIGDIAERGKGYATEALETMTQLAFSRLGVSEVVARVRPDNEASIRVLLGGGFVENERVFIRKAPSALLVE